MLNVPINELAVEGVIFNSLSFIEIRLAMVTYFRAVVVPKIIFGCYHPNSEFRLHDYRLEVYLWAFHCGSMFFSVYHVAVTGLSAQSWLT